MLKLGPYLYFLSAVLTLLSSVAVASSVSLPVDDKTFSKKPAKDLIYQGERIDAYKLLELQRNGLDLSSLDPYESELWQNTKHPLIQKQVEKQTFHFDIYKRAPTEIFSAIVTGAKDGKRYNITASLDNHTNIIRAGLLRLTGYKVELPIYYSELEVNFLNKEKRDEFLQKMGEQTLTKRTRWINEKKSTDTKLVLKDITLEPAKLENVNLYLPIMARDRQEERRTFRAMLALYTATDFPQSINAISWKIGRNFNNFLIFNHPYANQFNDASLFDLKWFQKRLNSLSTVEITKVISLAGYPKEIERLVLQKVLARFNALNEHLSLTHRFPSDRHYNGSNIKDGKLLSDLYQDRVVKYFKEDAENPYNFNDLFRLFRTQTTYNAFSTVLDEAIDNFVPGIRVSDAAAEISDQIADYRVENGNNPGVLPIRLFSYPTASVNASARRTIVFGNFMGASAPIQLVDTIAADANLGVFAGITGLDEQIIPNISASAGVTRSYTHVRAMPDLETATGQSLKKVLVPRVLQKVGSIIKDEFICTLDQTVNIERKTVITDGVETKIVYIKYDKSVENAKELAIKKRNELIADGENEDSILLVAIDKEEVCKDEIKKQKKENLEKFLKEFALNETFIITDSINLLGTAGATVPIDTILGTPLSLSLNGELSRGILRSVTIRKKEEALEVSIQKQRNINKSLSLGLNYFVEIVKATTKWANGKQNTLIYKIPTEGLTEEKRDYTLKTLRQLLTTNKLHLLEEHFSALTLDHDVEARLNTLRILWHKKESLLMDHNIQVTLPEKDYPELSMAQRQKSLFSTSSIRRNGRDFFGFLSSVARGFNRFLNIGQYSSDPGQSIKGDSKSRYYITEADISDGITPKVTTKIDYIWKGWSAPYYKLNQMFNFIEGLFDETQIDYAIDRSQFNSNGPLRGYEVRSTIIVYPTFYNRFSEVLINSPKEKAIQFLKDLYGNRKWDRYCQRRQRYNSRRFNRKKVCTPRAAKYLLSLRETGLPKDKERLVKTYNKILVQLLEGYDRKKVINWIGEENLFSSTRVTGFMQGDERGHIDYISNSYGQYSKEYGTGIFDSIGSLLGITPYELRALNYTPGM